MITNAVTQEQVMAVLSKAEKIVQHRVFGKCTVVMVKLPNGFVIVESTGCVDPKNYDEQIGERECMAKIEGKIDFGELNDRVRDVFIYGKVAGCAGMQCVCVCFKNRCRISISYNLRGIRALKVFVNELLDFSYEHSPVVRIDFPADGGELDFTLVLADGERLAFRDVAESSKADPLALPSYTRRIDVTFASAAEAERATGWIAPCT